MESTYGSDRAGLVCAFALRPDRPARAINADEAAALLQDAGSGEFLWLHFSLTNTFSTAEVSSASTVTVYVTQRLMVTARTTQLRAIDRLRAAVKGGETFGSPAELLAHLLRDQAHVLVDIVRDATRGVDAVEDRIISHQRTSRPQLGKIRRVMVRMQRLLAPEPAALFRLLNKPPPWVTERDLAELRQSAEELSAAVVDSVALNERVRLLQEELTALLCERTNQTLFILTVVTVLALPMTIIPGLFGMNIRAFRSASGPMDSGSSSPSLSASSGWERRWRGCVSTARLG